MAFKKELFLCFVAEDNNLLELASSQRVNLTSRNYNVTMKLVYPSDDECEDDERYLLTFSYAGPGSYDVVNSNISVITIETKDSKYITIIN